MPLRLVSEANAHEHWRARQKRAKEQRTLARMTLIRELRSAKFELPIRVTLTRIAPNRLDSDNLAGSGKHVRDGVADALGVNDRDDRVEWIVQQERGAPRTYGVRVRVEQLDPSRARPEVVRC